MGKQLLSGFLVWVLLSPAAMAGNAGRFQQDQLIESHQLFELARERAAADLVQSRRILDRARDALRRHRPLGQADREIAGVHSAKLKAFEIELEGRERHLRELTDQATRLVSKRSLSSAHLLLSDLPPFTPSADSRFPLFGLRAQVARDVRAADSLVSEGDRALAHHDPKRAVRLYRQAVKVNRELQVEDRIDQAKRVKKGSGWRTFGSVVATVALIGGLVYVTQQNRPEP